jgi:hypothetical protein
MRRAGCANGFWRSCPEMGIKRGSDNQGWNIRFKDDAPMLPSDLDSLTPTQRLIVEQAYVMAQELEAAGDSAPDGQVIDRCESFLLVNGRDFLRRVLEASLQTRAEVLEKKGGRPESARAGGRDATKAGQPKRR